MKGATWIVGSGGMLGSAVTRRIQQDAGSVLIDGPQIRWGQPLARGDLAAGLTSLVTSSSIDTWQVIWCAGAGVTATGSHALAQEFALFQEFLGIIAGLQDDIRFRGSVFLASSAGAVYGGSPQAPFDEFSPPIPLGDYGVAKLRAEDALCEFSVASGIPILIGRIANLYGPGQSLAKQQGIVSQLCKAALLGHPVSMFVSLDTRRDYIFVDDCATLVAESCSRLRVRPRGADPVIKILASGQSVTLASVLGEFRHVIGRRPRVVTGSSPQAGLQGRDLRFRSVVWPDLDRSPKTPLVVGMARTLADLARKLNASGATSMR